MGIITNFQLVEAFRRYLEEKWGYVFGGQGELYTKELAEDWQRRGRSVPRSRNKKTYFVGDCARWYGHKVADCSGGVVCAIREYEPRFGDRSANTFKRQFTESGRLPKIPEIPGLGLWRPGHIGIYEGDGNVLEFRGTDYGCVRTRLSERNFVVWGKINGVTYTERPVVNIQAPRVISAAAPQIHVVGKSVNVRSLPNTNGEVLGIARADERYKLIDNGWHYIDFGGTPGWISGRADLTEFER